MRSFFWDEDALDGPSRRDVDGSLIRDEDFDGWRERRKWEQMEEETRDYYERLERPSDPA